jgi:intergrase/recombinase
MVKLACILGDVLRALCSPRARLISERGVGLENISKSLEKRIIEWKASLPVDLNLTDDELARIARDDIDTILKKKLNNGG